jgi:hypothetical protein
MDLPHTLLCCDRVAEQYVKHVLGRALIFYKDDETRPWEIYVHIKDVPRIKSMFHYMLIPNRDDPQFENHPCLTFDDYTMEDLPGGAQHSNTHTGIYFYMEKNLKPIVLDYLDNLAVSVRTSVYEQTHSKGNVLIVLCTDPLSQRFALARDLLENFKEEIEAYLIDRWNSPTFAMYGESICRVQLGEITSEELAFEVHKSRPKRLKNLKCLWNVTTRDFLEHANRGTNEKELFQEYTNFLSGLKKRIDYRRGSGPPKVERCSYM